MCSNNMVADKSTFTTDLDLGPTSPDNLVRVCCECRVEKGQRKRAYRFQGSCRGPGPQGIPCDHQARNPRRRPTLVTIFACFFLPVPALLTTAEFDFLAGAIR